MQLNVLHGEQVANELHHAADLALRVASDCKSTVRGPEKLLIDHVSHTVPLHGHDA